MSKGALDGMRVVEVASYVTGPYAGMMLGDLGAEVIKIEEPEHGDPYRSWGEAGDNPFFLSLNRNKKSVTLDLKDERGRATLRRLAATADVLVENSRPGVAERLGYGYEELRPHSPRLVYCAISGFGSSGPYRDRPGYDTTGQAMSGLLSVLTDREDPKLPGISLADHLTGVFACYGILGALLARERTGAGQRVETSLLQSCVAFLGEHAARYFASGRPPTRETRVRSALVFAFLGSDGLPFVIHLSSPQKFFEGLVAAVGRPELATDPRFKTRPARVENHGELVAALSGTFTSAPRAQWLERLLAHDVPCAPLNTLAEMFADPQVRHLGLRTSTTHPVRGTTDAVMPAVRLEGTPLQIRLAPPMLGEHTAEVLADLEQRESNSLEPSVEERRRMPLIRRGGRRRMPRSGPGRAD